MAAPVRYLLDNDEVDIKALHIIIDRFRQHHALRFRQSCARLPLQQQRCLEALPLLFHWNHAALPGYINEQVPAGFPGYRPMKSSSDALRILAPSFEVEPFREPQQRLQAMFIMGSGGSVAQNSASDIDIWICCDTHLHAALWPKVQMLHEWAEDLGLEIQAFLVDPSSFRQSRDLPGCNTPNLLLDEFYRSASLIAGKYPLWWLIPSEDHHQYYALRDRLLHYRFIESNNVIDFGPVAPFPPAELAEAALMELERALTTPHKSLLKLKLVEIYAENPSEPPLSTTYKAALHEGITDAKDLDTYIMLYHYIDRCLDPNESLRRFIQNLFIRKTTCKKGPQAAILDELFESWGLSRRDIRYLRAPERWPFSELLRENAEVIQALLSGLKLVYKLALPGAERPDSNEAAEETTRWHWLNEQRRRRVETSLDRLTAPEHGSVFRLNPALLPERYDCAVSITQTSDGWLAKDKKRTVYTTSRLVEVALWARINSLTAVCGEPDHPLADHLLQITSSLGESTMQVFVNAELASADEIETLLVQQDDPLDYSGLHKRQVLSLDLVRHMANGDWTVDTFIGKEQVVEGIRKIFSDNKPVTWVAIGDLHRLRIQSRLAGLAQQARVALELPNNRFVFPFGEELVCLTRLSDRLDQVLFTDPGKLADHLAITRGEVTFDADSFRLSHPPKGLPHRS
ncbi:MAG: class I adenylate cyclase [Gammaproteobacteria bacterium]|nr:class I adenylate cyclase [Gammaproteobacteria bacterium]